MTAVRAWNGSAWVTPSFLTSKAGLGNDWEKYVIPGSWTTDFQMLYQQCVIYDGPGNYQVGWNFADGLQGWYGQYRPDTLWWEAEHIVFYPNYQYGDSDYYYSPDFRGSAGQVYWGDVNAHLRYWNSVGPWPYLGVNLYMDKWNNPSRVQYYFTYVGEPVYFHITPAMPQNYLGAGFQSYGWGNDVTVSRTIDVNYWNGSLWVPQNAL